MAAKLISTFLIITFLTFLTGCQIFRRQQIESELKQLKLQQEKAKQSLDSKKQSLSSLQNQAAKLSNELTANRNEAIALLRNNPGKVACVASGTVAVSDSNLFSDDIKEIGAAVGLGCIAVYIFSETFQQEVDEFVADINQASAREERLLSQIESLKPKVAAAAKDWQAEKSQFDEISQKVTDLESELEKLR